MLRGLVAKGVTAEDVCPLLIWRNEGKNVAVLMAIRNAPPPWHTSRALWQHLSGLLKDVCQLSEQIAARANNDRESAEETVWYRTLGACQGIVLLEQILEEFRFLIPKCKEETSP
jgi:hypothetical protein